MRPRYSKNRATNASTSREKSTFVRADAGIVPEMTLNEYLEHLVECEKLTRTQAKKIRAVRNADDFKAYVKDLTRRNSPRLSAMAYLLPSRQPERPDTRKIQSSKEDHQQ